MTHHPHTIQPGWVPPRSVPAKKPSVVPGILLIVAGALGLGVAIVIAVVPMFLFLLGGGGNVDAFDDVASGFAITGLVVGVVSVLVLIAGIVLTTIVARKRRSFNPPRVWTVNPPVGSQQWQPPAGPRAPRR
ncbi:hypothetical protein [Brevibacterium spongiae]|uniref:DUF4190 domain-containing protein n=1 Tax=Brevibacterium spongiae TaxID=2909672 RepID=A0ABY5SNX5_9MICO|nr:hypothetical protein [Brevibacterium spongiae]UVI36010.1 hypothetical protein L1F31_18150 [Brevibacterium spongiae]